MRRRQFEEEMMMMENMAPMDRMSNPWEDGFGSPFGPRGRGGMRGGMRGMGRRSFPDMGDMMGMGVMGGMDQDYLAYADNPMRGGRGGRGFGRGGPAPFRGNAKDRLGPRPGRASFPQADQGKSSNPIFDDLYETPFKSDGDGGDKNSMFKKAQKMSSGGAGPVLGRGGGRGRGPGIMARGGPVGRGPMRGGRGGAGGGPPKATWSN